MTRMSKRATRLPATPQGNRFDGATLRTTPRSGTTRDDTERYEKVPTETTKRVLGPREGYTARAPIHARGRRRRKTEDGAAGNVLRPNQRELPEAMRTSWSGWFNWKRRPRRTRRSRLLTLRRTEATTAHPRQLRGALKDGTSRIGARRRTTSYGHRR